MNISKKIKDLRIKRGLSTTMLAKKADLSQGYISDIENGRTTPSIKTIEKISEALNVNPAYFIDSETDVLTFTDLISLTPETEEFIKNNPNTVREWLELALDCERENITPGDLRVVLKIIRQVNKRPAME